MATSRTVLSRFAIALAAPALLFLATASQAFAAPPPHIPLGARGFEISQILQAYHQHGGPSAPTPVPPWARPAEKHEFQEYVTITGPDGRSRTFLLVGEVIQGGSRPIFVYHSSTPVTTARQ